MVGVGADVLTYCFVATDLVLDPYFPFMGIQGGLTFEHFIRCLLVVKSFVLGGLVGVGFGLGLVEWWPWKFSF